MVIFPGGAAIVGLVWRWLWWLWFWWWWFCCWLWWWWCWRDPPPPPVPTRLAALAGELSSSREGASLSVYHLPNITCNLFPPNSVILIGAIKEEKGCYRYGNEIRGEEDWRSIKRYCHAKFKLSRAILIPRLIKIATPATCCRRWQ